MQGPFLQLIERAQLQFSFQVVELSTVYDGFMHAPGSPGVLSYRMGVGLVDCTEKHSSLTDRTVRGTSHNSMLAKWIY